MIKGERSLEGKKLDNVAYNTPNLLLRLLRYKPGNRKINIICPGIHMKVSRVDNMIVRCDKVRRLFELGDYDGKVKATHKVAHRRRDYKIIPLFRNKKFRHKNYRTMIQNGAGAPQKFSQMRHSAARI